MSGVVYFHNFWIFAMMVSRGMVTAVLAGQSSNLPRGCPMGVLVIIEIHG
jgi:hypothetical protein